MEIKEILGDKFIKDLEEKMNIEIKKQKMMDEIDLNKITNSNLIPKFQEDFINEFINHLIYNYQNISLINTLKVAEYLKNKSVESLEKNILVKRNITPYSNSIHINNNLKIYNMCVLDNIMSYNTENANLDALDYFGFKIKYNELPKYVEYYMKGILELGITNNDIITVCLPYTIENILIILALNKLQILSNNVFLEQLIYDFDKYTIEKKSYILINLDGYLQFFNHYLK